jgi:hypothetical protein
MIDSDGGTIEINGMALIRARERIDLRLKCHESVRDRFASLNDGQREALERLHRAEIEHRAALDGVLAAFSSTITIDEQLKEWKPVRRPVPDDVRRLAEDLM